MVGEGEYVETVSSNTLEPLPDGINQELIDAYYDIPIKFTSISLGSGATVAPSYRRAHARLYFSKTLYKLAPETATSLATDDARRAAMLVSEKWIASRSDRNAAMDAGEDVADNLEVGPIKPHLRNRMLRAVELFDRYLNSQEVQDLKSAAAFLSRHVNDWQERWTLTDEWIADAAYLTLDVLRAYQEDGHWFEGPLVLDMESLKATAHDGKQPNPLRLLPFDLPYAPSHEQIYIPVYLDALKHPDVVLDDGELEDDGDFGDFDPRTQTVEAAVKRLMPALEARLRRALEHIATEDQTLNGAMPPLAYRSATAFEWLVRYQVLGETKAGIARTDNKDRRHVVREINRAAALIGLTLRESKGGRPRRDSGAAHETVR